MVLGALGAAAAVATGLYAKDGVMIAPSVRVALLDNHEHFMIAFSVLAGALALWALVSPADADRGGDGRSWPRWS